MAAPQNVAGVHDSHDATLEEIVAACEQHTANGAPGHLNAGLYAAFEGHLVVSGEHTGTIEAFFRNPLNPILDITSQSHGPFEAEMRDVQQQSSLLAPGAGVIPNGPTVMDTQHQSHDPQLYLGNWAFQGSQFDGNFPVADTGYSGGLEPVVSHRPNIAMTGHDFAGHIPLDNVSHCVGNVPQPLNPNVGLNYASIGFTQITGQLTDLAETLLDTMNIFQSPTGDATSSLSTTNVQGNLPSIHAAPYDLTSPTPDYLGGDMHNAQPDFEAMAVIASGGPTDSFYQATPASTASGLRPSSNFLGVPSELLRPAGDTQQSMVTFQPPSVTSKRKVFTPGRHEATRVIDGTAFPHSSDLVGPAQKQHMFEAVEYINPEVQQEREKRRRILASSQKKTRNVDEKIERACILCKPDHRKCNTPCPKYQAFVRSHAHLLSDPMFTRDVRIDFLSTWSSLFNSPVSERKEHLAQRYEQLFLSEESTATQKLLDPFIPVLDALDPNYNRRMALRHLGNDLSTFTYLQGIIRWKRELSQIFPPFSSDLDALEQRYKDTMHVFLGFLHYWFCDGDKVSMTIIIACIYDEVCSLSYLDTVNQAAAKHLKQALDLYFIRFGGYCLASMASSDLGLNSGQPRSNKTTKERSSPRKRTNPQRAEEAKLTSLFAGIPESFQRLLLHSKLHRFLPAQCEKHASTDPSENDLASFPTCLRDTWPNIHNSFPGSISPSFRECPPNYARTTKCLCSLVLHCFPGGGIFPVSGVREGVHSILARNGDEFQGMTRFFGDMFSRLDNDHVIQHASYLMATICRHVLAIVFRSWIGQLSAALASSSSLEGSSLRFPLNQLWRATTFFVSSYTATLLEPCLSAYVESMSEDRKSFFRSGEVIEEAYNQMGLKDGMEAAMAETIDDISKRAIEVTRQETAHREDLGESPDEVGRWIYG